MKTKMQYCYGIGVFLLLLSLFINSCTQQNFVNISKSKSVGDIYLASNNRDSLNIIDSLTTGFFSQSFAVDAPHSNAIHSIAFYRTNMFDYRIMDERYSQIDIYQGTWIYVNDSIRISIDNKWVADYNWESILDSTEQIIGKKPKIDTTWSEGSSGYYRFLKDILTYNYNEYRGGTVCFPKRYQTQNCLLKTTTSFLHELKNTANKK